jgi:hypothetical protein
MFEITNVALIVKQIAEASDFEGVCVVELYCAECGTEIDNDELEKWLLSEFPLVLSCLTCHEHTVINFQELEGKINGRAPTI